MLSKQFSSHSIQLKTMYFLSCVASLDDTQVNWKTGMHPFIGISMEGEGVTCTVYQYQYAGSGGGVVYDLNIVRLI